MRVIFLMVTFLLLNIGIFGSESTYLIADGSLGADDIYITGLKSNGDILEAGDVVIDRVKTYKYSGDVEVGLFKLSIADGGSGSKIVVGYEQGGEYILLSTKEAEGDENISDNYDNATGAEDYLGLIDPQDYMDEKIFYEKSPYERFPGYEVDEGRIIMGVRVGDAEIEDEERTEPSNIVEKFFTEEKVGKKVNIEAGINPNNSTDEFLVKDSSGKTLISMKKESGTDYIVVGDNSYGLKNNKSDLNEDDEIIVSEDELKLNNSNILEGEAPFEITIRIKKKLTRSTDNSVVKIDDKVIPFSGDTKNYNLSGVDSFKLIYSGKGNGFDFIIENDGGDNESVVIEGEGETKEADVVYVIEGVGTKYEGSVQMSSKSEGSGRQRVSNVNIEVLVNDKGGLEIESISE